MGWLDGRKDGDVVGSIDGIKVLGPQEGRNVG